MNSQQPKPTCKDIIRNNLPRCEELFQSGIFDIKSENDHCKLFRQSAFTELLIRLHDILKHLNKNGKRICCSEHVQIDNDVRDITDLISKLRNAACHMTSKNRTVSGTNIEFAFNIAKGNITILNSTGINIGCEFEDDTAYFYGNFRIYLIRHIKCLLEHLKKIESKLSD